MIAAAAWLCLLAPLAGALLITLAGTHIARTLAGWIATLSVFIGFAGAVVAFVKVAGESPDDRAHTSAAFTWLGVRIGASFEFKVPMEIFDFDVGVTSDGSALPRGELATPS